MSEERIHIIDAEEPYTKIMNYIIEDVLEQDLFNTWVKEGKELQDSLGIE